MTMRVAFIAEIPADIYVPAPDLAISYVSASSLALSAVVSRASRMLFWSALEPTPTEGTHRVLNFAGRIAPDPQGQRYVLQQLLNGEPMLARPKNPQLFLAICRSTGVPASRRDIEGHRHNSARNFDRMIASFALGKVDSALELDRTVYLYEAENSTDIQLMLERDPLARMGAWEIHTYAARFELNTSINGD